MKDSFQNIGNKLKPLGVFFKRNFVFIFIVLQLIILSFLVYRINQYNQTEPTEEAIQEKLQTVQRPRIDQSALDKIQQLQDQNVQVDSLFNQARNNPFNE